MVSTYVPNSYGDMVEIVEDYPEGYVMHSDYAALEARVAGLERDAARYRHIADQHSLAWEEDLDAEMEESK